MPVTSSVAGNARPTQLVDLALQGGGSHGAFTWGVLDRLLEERWIEIEAISGTSAGAMNAAVMAYGHARGNPGARESLETFWHSVSKAALFSPLQRSPVDVLLGRWTLDHSPAYVALDLLGRIFSPYDLGFGGRTLCSRSCPTRSISPASPRPPSSFSSRRRTSGPEGRACSATRR